MDAFFDAMRIHITKPCTASWPARVTRAGFCFGRNDSKDIMPSGAELSLLMTFYWLNSIQHVDPAMTRLHRPELGLPQRVSWLHF